MKKGFAPVVIILIIFSFALLYLAVWAPWVTDKLAYQRAAKSLNSSCRQLTQNEYQPPVINPYWKQPSIPEQLGLVPPFGKETTLYVICDGKSTKNIYFVSFFGTVKLKESTPILLKSQIQQTKNAPDETANWKTYTSNFYGYSLNYPQDANIGEELTTKGISGKEQAATINYQGGTLKIVGNSCGIGVSANKQTKLTIAGITTDKYYESETSIKIKAIGSPKGDQICLSAILPANNTTLVDQTFDKILATFKFTSDETVNWKTYETDKFSISYPPNWVLDHSFPEQFDISFKSVDYSDDGGFPTILKGFQVHLYIGRGQGLNPPKLGLVNTEPATWLGKKASLDKIAWEGTMVRLWTNETSKDLFMTMATPPNEKPQFKSFEDNRRDFLAVSNSLKLK